MLNITTNEKNQIKKEEIKQLISEKLNQLEELEKGSIYIKQLSEIALLQIEIEKFDDAENNIKLCLTHFIKQKDRLGQASALGLLGTLNMKRINYHEAIDYYRKALKIYSELNQKMEEIVCLKSIGNCYLNLNNLDKANDIFLECSELSSNQDDIYSFLDCLGYLIRIYEEKGNEELLYELYQKSLKAFQEIKDQKGIIISYYNMGILKKRMSNYQDALLNFKKGTNRAIDANFAELIIRGLSYVGESLFHLGKIKEASYQYIRALDLAERVKAKNAKIQINIILKSFGLSEKKIEKMLEDYRNKKSK
ncbi:MAG: tetratricopeptide repeat protein [Candidatus Lokiarchaeota archaeon]|nr:tetratricopeptide repeat protein [Candidatus Lokiarchaeota archaeon]MBD3200856.1 tetratricopeptide repeat protein [Candidatus Lokiarchaeota archaeon]